jgi:hypothetical protein
LAGWSCKKKNSPQRRRGRGEENTLRMRKLIILIQIKILLIFLCASAVNSSSDLRQTNHHSQKMLQNPCDVYIIIGEVPRVILDMLFPGGQNGRSGDVGCHAG